MKRLSFFIGLLCSVLLFSSCSSVSKGLLGFEKRQHLRGYHFIGGNHSFQTDSSEESDIGRLDIAADSSIIIYEPTVLKQTQLESMRLLADKEKHTSALTESSSSHKKIRPSNSSVNFIAPKDLALDDTEPDPKTVSKSLPGIISLLISIGNVLLLMYLPFIGLFTGFLAILFGVRARKIGDKTARILGTVSIVISVFTLFISLLFTLLLITGIQVFG